MSTMQQIERARSTALRAESVSAARVGKEWRQEDHERLVQVLARVEREAREKAEGR